MSEKTDKLKEMIAILKSHGIEMKVGGCGCCGSPWVKFECNGKLVFDDDLAEFDTQEEPYEGNYL